MKKACHSIFLIALLFGLFLSAKAQDTANDLIKQGIALHNQGRYADAVAKFNEVLKTDPQNAYANYEVAFSLFAAKKPQEAIPHLDIAVKSENTSLSVAAYCLLAGIYDDGHQSAKAIETYLTAIKLNPSYPQIYYNLGVAQSRNQQYTDAENSAVEAIKRNPRHAGSQRLYALVTFHQNKRANALLAFCSFILLEPTGPRAAEAYGNIQHIIEGGALNDAAGNTAITFDPKDGNENSTLNLGITLAVQAGKTKGLTGEALLEYQLKSIFALAGQLSEKKTDKSFFDNFFAAYFYKLSQSNNMATFIRTIAQSADQSAAAWLKQNEAQSVALADWIKITERGF